MKLLIVVNVDWFFCSHRLPVAIAAHNAGYEVHIATTFTKSSYFDHLSEYGFKLHRLNIDRSGKNIVSYFDTALRLSALFIALKPDIIHLVTIQPVLIGGFLARIFKSPSVVFAISGLGHSFVGNSLFSRLRRLIVLICYREALKVKSRAVLFQNPDDKIKLSRICSLSNTETYLLAGSGVDLSRFAYNPMPDLASPVIVMASRLLYTKGVREYVHAADILHKRGVRALFKLIGSPDITNPASVQLNDLTEWRKCDFIDIVDHSDKIEEIFSAAHIVCLPSYYPEGLPKVLCEAAACGRAVITSDEPGCRDAIENGLTGLLIPSRNSVALADALEYLLSRPKKIIEMGLLGRKRAEEYFDINAIVLSHLQVYSSLLSSN